MSEPTTESPGPPEGHIRIFTSVGELPYDAETGFPKIFPLPVLLKDKDGNVAIRVKDGAGNTHTFLTKWVVGIHQHGPLKPLGIIQVTETSILTQHRFDDLESLLYPHEVGPHDV